MRDLQKRWEGDWGGGNLNSLQVSSQHRLFNESVDPVSCKSLTDKNLFLICEFLSCHRLLRIISSIKINTVDGPDGNVNFTSPRSDFFWNL